ncbi:DUF2306 domain-containing protein [Microbacterium sp. G2-8]|uniref:DUF2306 domain-containing protein n=1 Tax=Microbacterium sp. G2-8 TaxID=2842454 RepID=UPI001C8AF3B0|nr:DUF2306 domain-containing protein [Microbacterium sp. G2-8]
MTSPASRIPAREWLIAAGLIVLALIPAAAGGVRLGDVAVGMPTAATARFHADPLPLVLHIVSALVFAFVGAFQFLPAFRRRNTGWHMFAGRVLLVPSGVIVSVSGLWMTAAYVFPPIDGPGLALSRGIVGIATLAFLAFGVRSIIRRDVRSHGAWMIRAYALAMGAGTQVLTSAPFAIAFGEPTELWRLVQMDAGWIVNAIAAEVIIRRMHARRPVRAAA